MGLGPEIFLAFNAFRVLKLQGYSTFRIITSSTNPTKYRLNKYIFLKEVGRICCCASNSL